MRNTHRPLSLEQLHIYKIIQGYVEGGLQWYDGTQHSERDDITNAL